MSPAAKMSGSEVRRCSSTTMPLSILRPAVCGEFGARGDAHANNDHVRVDPGPVAQHDTRHRPVPARQFGRRGSVAQVHTMAAV